jgi:branched-chain amino acid transport system ATP-binding protein
MPDVKLTLVWSARDAVGAVLGSGEAPVVGQIARLPLQWEKLQPGTCVITLKLLENNLGSQLSGGEQQMLTIGRTLMGDPEIILLDEPTEGLAPLIAQDVFNMILKIRNAHNTSIFLVEQFSPHLLDFIDHCYVMERGRIVYDGEPQTIKTDLGLQKQLLGIGAKK